ncbi:hypothetical protein [Salmonella phage PKM.Hi.22.6]|uniref:Uncharacterized protein n=1 Tax=phage PKM.Lu.22.1 TaxID=3049197 RepID=A0AAF0KYH5_9CAUD|nr:hypothetical protein [phage PKM.Lu.22.1]WKV17110.1 hypothetical protein [Salmonella phage PKM.Hi.22.6]
MSKLVIEYREYTTKGRFVSSAVYQTLPELVSEDIEILFETNDEPTRIQVGKIYKQQKLMKAKEELKELFRTNVVVRDLNTGRFTKWAN